MKRKTYAARAVLPYMHAGETYYEAEQRLNTLWARGEHPEQVRVKNKRERQYEYR